MAFPVNVTHEPVTSSMLTHVGYDAENQRLHLTYKNGKTYVHKDVPPDVHEALMAEAAKDGGSIGRHFNTHIKGKYGLAD